MKQQRWDEGHAGTLKFLRRHKQLMEVADVRPRMTVLDVGCGRGEVAWLATQAGAQVTVLDIGPKLVASAMRNVGCEGRCGSITSLPFGNGEFDRVLGAAVLHHLLPADVVRAVAEARRVLKPSGRAFFLEPIENSRVFDFVQNLIPTDSRPSILQRGLWRKWLLYRDDRVMTDDELVSAGDGTIIGYRGLLTRIWETPAVMALDAWLVAARSPLRRFAQTAIVEYRSAAQLGCDDRWAAAAKSLDDDESRRTRQQSRRGRGVRR